jgi:predicted dehydrogenase
MDHFDSSGSPQTAAPLLVGVIGLGYAGETHMSAFSDHPATRVVAIAGKETERLAELATLFGAEVAATGWEDVVAHPSLDIISIATPNALHHPIAMAALAAGKHVFCEKPLAVNKEQAHDMVNAAEKAGKVLEVAFNYRRREDIRYAKQRVSSGHLGEVYHVRASWKRRAGIPGLTSWFTSPSLAGGGALIDLGPHLLDSLLFILGQPRIVAVSAVTHGQLGRAGYGAMDHQPQMATAGHFDVEDLCSALLRLDTGASVALEITWASHTGDDEDISIELLGVESGLRIFIPRYATENTVTEYGDRGGKPYTDTPAITSTGNGHRAVITEFIDHVVSGAKSAHTAHYAAHQMDVIDAIYESARTGREVSL